MNPSVPAAPGPTSNSGGASALQDIERRTGLQFPAGTQLIRHDLATDSDALLRARLSMTPAQWAAFTASLQLPADAFEEERRYLLGTNDGWWTPKTPAALPTTQVPRPDAKVLNLGVDSSQPAQLQIYLVWHAT